MSWQLLLVNWLTGLVGRPCVVHGAATYLDSCSMNRGGKNTRYYPPYLASLSLFLSLAWMGNTKNQVIRKTKLTSSGSANVSGTRRLRFVFLSLPALVGTAAKAGDAVASLFRKLKAGLRTTGHLLELHSVQLRVRREGSSTLALDP